MVEFIDIKKAKINVYIKYDHFLSSQTISILNKMSDLEVICISSGDEVEKLGDTTTAAKRYKNNFILFLFLFVARLSVPLCCTYF